MTDRNKDSYDSPHMLSDFGFMVAILGIAVALVGIGYVLGNLRSLIECL